MPYSNYVKGGSLATTQMEPQSAYVPPLNCRKAKLPLLHLREGANVAAIAVCAPAASICLEGFAKGGAVFWRLLKGLKGKQKGNLSVWGWG